MLGGLALRARLTARRIAFVVVGGVLLTIGVCFFVAAIWSLIAAAFGPVAASAVLGAIFCGLGLLFFALAPRSMRSRSPVVPAPTSGTMVLDAFFSGLRLGQKLRRPRR